MQRIRAAAAVLVVAILSGPGAVAEETATVTFKSLKLATALELAQATLKACRAKDTQIAVSVVDRGGSLQVALRDRFAGPHTPDTSFRKAWTALSFRTDTLELARLTEKGEAWAIRNVRQALPLGGGVQVRDGEGSLLGAVGVSGAPSGAVDEDCAKAGIEAIQDKIAF